jgi:ABC-type Fe3+-siderophore transport system permease subunit
LTEDDRWRRTEPPRRGPSAPPDLRFDPFATALGVFLAIAIPFLVAAYSQSGTTSTVLVVAGIVIGLLVGILVGLWVADRDGEVWKGPHM